ncbi:MAG TPA: tetratricopeptide repeat protein [Planctomycetota bacterium]|nr:tetratricopeptide repeat protein [Planctomycetota bacterium]
MAPTPPAQEPRAQEPVPRDTASLLADGEGRFASAVPAIMQGSPAAEREHLLAAERLLRAVLARDDATPAQQQRAMFYLAATLSRLGRDDESFALETRWLERFPDGSEASLVRYYMADHLRRKGRLDEAKVLYERVLRDDGDSTLGAPSRFYLEQLRGGRPAAPPPQGRDAPDGSVHAKRAVMAPAAPGARYLVVAIDLAADRAADAGYLAAAHAAGAFHGGDVWAWDGEDFGSLERQLRERGPENVLFVARPERLDLVLHRRILLLSAGIDDDWFVDFAFGYLTAEDGAACERLWQRIVTVHRRSPLHGVWWQASVTSNATSLEYADAASALAKAAGFRGPHYYYSTANDDRAALIERSLATMRSASVVEFTGCGDPQGIWLFDDRRNLDDKLHWDYAADRVGADTGSMPRLLAARFRELTLDAPILWSGTCHSGAVCRVFVEADIVSTFGRTARTTVHRLAPRDSLALSWLAAGAASLLVPLGANHGMSVAMEVDFALRNGASLGETIQSTYDDVLLAAQGRLVLDLPVEGEPHGHDEAVMQGGGSNRILIGDPALRPFAAVDSAAAAAEKVTAERTEAGLRVTVERAAGWQPRAWDMYGQDRDRDYRALVRVDLGALGLQDRTDFDARVSAHAPGGAPLPYAMQRAAVEDHAGHRFLHLQANGPRARLDREAATIVFDVVAK